MSTKQDAYSLVDARRSDAPHGYGLLWEHGGVRNYRSWTDQMRTITDQATHYNGPPTTNNLGAILGAERFHINGRGWRGLAYNWAVSGGGFIYEARGFNQSGAQVGATNTYTAAVYYPIGGTQAPTAQQLESGEWLARRILVEVYGRNLNHLGHQETVGANTACPGVPLMAWVRANRLWTSHEPDQEEEMAFTPAEEKELKGFVAAMKNQGTDGGFVNVLIPLIRAGLVTKSDLAAIGGGKKDSTLRTALRKLFKTQHIPAP